MCGVKSEMIDFFVSKLIMNFLEIFIMFFGINEFLDEIYMVEIESDDNGNYKKIIYKDGKIYGVIF